MTFSDETLMAYADGELGPKERAAIDTAMASDPQVAKRVAHYRAQREALRGAFEEILHETVPERLVNAARTAPASAPNVVALDEARSRRSSGAQRRWAWPEWSAMAASLLVGLIVGHAMFRTGDAPLVAVREGTLVARGELAAALTDRISGDGAGDSRIDIGISYRAKAGGYCRTFAVTREQALAGIACREGDAWRVHAVTQPGAGTAGEYRMAGGAVPPLIVQAIGSQIDGEPLDSSAEAAARGKGWQE